MRAFSSDKLLIGYEIYTVMYAVDVRTDFTEGFFFVPQVYATHGVVLLWGTRCTKTFNILIQKCTVDLSLCIYIKQYTVGI